MSERKNVSLAPYTSIKVGGLASSFWGIRTREDLIAAQKFAGQDKVLILGGGSDSLLPDGEIPLVWKMMPSGKPLTLIGTGVKIWAGDMIAQVAWQAVKNGWKNLENFTTLPGSVGGAVWGNAHAGGILIGAFVEKIEVFDRDRGEFLCLSADELDFAYDYSRLQKNPALVITNVWLKVTPGADPDLLARQARALMAKKRQTQAFSEPSAGCFWQNPPNTPDLQSRFPQFAKQALIPAGFLIDQLHLDWTGCPAATGKHCSFIVNKGAAAQADILECARKIQVCVYHEYGVWLRPEVVIYREDLSRDNLPLDKTDIL